MNNSGIRIGMVLLTLVLMIGTSYAAEINPVTGGSNVDSKELPALNQLNSVTPLVSVVNFDDISLPSDTYQQITNYAGITWDSGIPDYYGGSDGHWSVYNSLSYATPQSAPNYVFNSYGAINPGFSFGSQVQFNGAYFMLVNTSGGINPSQVRFAGYTSGVLTSVSNWLTLTTTPTYLAANFAAVDRVVVEMNGDGWFGMDDVSYGIVGDIPTLTLTTNKPRYVPGETVLLTISVTNPTNTPYASSLGVDLFWPTGSGINVGSVAFIMPPGMNVVRTIPMVIPNSPFVPDGSYQFDGNLNYNGNTVTSSAVFDIQRLYNY